MGGLTARWWAALIACRQTTGGGGEGGRVGGRAAALRGRLSNLELTARAYCHMEHRGMTAYHSLFARSDVVVLIEN